MDELEQEYKGKVDIIRFSLTEPAANCELTKLGMTHIPAMVYIDAKGNKVGTTEDFQEKDQLKQRLNDLLNG